MQRFKNKEKSKKKKRKQKTKIALDKKNDFLKNIKCNTNVI